MAGLTGAHRTPIRPASRLPRVSEIDDIRTAHEVWWVPLPDGAESPVVAYVNGAARSEGEGITVRDGAIEFDEPLPARPKMGIGRSIMLLLGIGVYGDLKGDTLDLSFHRNGRLESRAEIGLSPAPRRPR